MISFLLILFIDNDFAKKFILLTAFETMHQNRGIITFFNKNFVIIKKKKVIIYENQAICFPTMQKFECIPNKSQCKNLACNHTLINPFLMNLTNVGCTLTRNHRQAKVMVIALNNKKNNILNNIE
jgi:hypothetical protein